ncbi:40S ribosomal protein S5-1 [Hordeum vulgare]|nr:40S ribosomal protein S5-1 [Hordeum vulgare]
MDQDVVFNDASRDPTSSSIVSHFCLMDKSSKVSPTLNPDISHDDIDDDNEDEDDDEESDNIASLKIKGEMIFKALCNNKLACYNFMEIMYIAIEGEKYIEELESHLEEHEATIEKMEGYERDYANEIAELSQALENEQTTKEYLEETFALELSKLKESHDRALEDKIFEKVINPYLTGVLQHPQSIEMREGMFHIRDVEGPKKTGSMETRLEAMEQQVFKCQGMVERGFNANHMMITEFTNKHRIHANDIGKHLSRLYDRIDQLQAQIYDL